MNCEAPFSSLVPCPDRCYGPVQRMLGRMPRLSSPGQTHRSLQDGSGVTLPKNLSKKKRWQVCVCIRAGRTGESSPGTAVYNEGMSERQSDHLHVQESPRLDRATLVLALTGWMDGGDVSTGTVQRLVDLLGARPIATIDPEPFYLYNFPARWSWSRCSDPTSASRRAGSSPSTCRRTPSTATNPPTWSSSSARSRTCTGAPSASASSSWRT